MALATNGWLAGAGMSPLLCECPKIGGSQVVPQVRCPPAILDGGRGTMEASGVPGRVYYRLPAQTDGRDCSARISLRPIHSLGRLSLQSRPLHLRQRRIGRVWPSSASAASIAPGREHLG
jgi:hypothetical protein